MDGQGSSNRLIKKIMKNYRSKTRAVYLIPTLLSSLSYFRPLTRSKKLFFLIKIPEIRRYGHLRRFGTFHFRCVGLHFSLQYIYIYSDFRLSQSHPIYIKAHPPLSHHATYKVLPAICPFAALACHMEAFFCYGRDMIPWLIKSLA